MEEEKEKLGSRLKKFITSSKFKKIIALVILIVMCLVLLTGDQYVSKKDEAKFKKNDKSNVPYAASTYTSSAVIGEDGKINTSMTPEELWDKMKKNGSNVGNYLKNAKQLSRLMQAQLVTQYMDTRPSIEDAEEGESTIEDDIDWDEIWKDTDSTEVQGIIKMKREDSEGNSTRMTYVDQATFNQWISDYNSSGSEDAKQKLMTHFTLNSSGTGGYNTGDYSSVMQLAKEYCRTWEGCTEISSDGTKYKIQPDGGGGLCVGHGVDINAQGDKIRAAGYSTSNGSWVGVDVVDKIEEEELTAYYENVMAETSGLNLTDYQIAILISRAYNAGPYGWKKARNGKTFVQAYNAYWSSEKTQSYFGKKDDESIYSEPMFTTYMAKPDSSKTGRLEGLVKRRKDEWRGFATGYLGGNSGKMNYQCGSTSSDSGGTSANSVNVNLSTNKGGLTNVTPEISQKIVAAAKRTPSTGVHRCQAWVATVYANAGLGGYVSRGSAYKAYKQCCVSKDKNNIPVGAAVYGTGSGSKDGHVGIYMGNGMVMDNQNGRLKTSTLDQWIAWQARKPTVTGETPGWLGWGWQSGIALNATYTTESTGSVGGIQNNINYEDDEEDEDEEFDDDIDEEEEDDEEEDNSETTSETSSGPTGFIWPLPSQTRISWNFGQDRGDHKHGGIDISTPTGTDVYAAAGGTVQLAKYGSPSAGNYIIIDHGNGYITKYMHNSQLLVSTGDTVTQGQVIAKSGNTGRSHGPHLHYEIHQNGQKQDPHNYYNDDGTPKAGVNMAATQSNTTQQSEEDKGNYAIVATWQETTTTIETNDPSRSGGSTTQYMATTQNVYYQNLTSGYIMPFDYLWIMLLITENKSYVFDLADLVYNSEIEFTVYDNLVVSTNVSREDYTKTVKYTPSIITKNGKTYTKPVTKTISYYYQVTTTTKTNTINVVLTRANVWMLDLNREKATYNPLPENAEAVPELNPDDAVTNTQKEDLKTISTNYDENTKEIALDAMKEAAIADGTNQTTDNDVTIKSSEIYISKEETTVTNTATNTGASSYVLGAEEITEKTDKKAEDPNFVTVLLAHKNAKNSIIGQAIWLFEFLSANKNTADLVDLTKYLLYCATNIYYGVDDFDFSVFVKENLQTVNANGIYGNTNEEKVWFTLRARGYSEIAVASMMGHLFGESTNIDPTAVNSSSGASGIGQWLGVRKQGLMKFATSRGTEWTDFDTQLLFLIGELTPGGGADGYAIDNFLPSHGYTRADWENATSFEPAIKAIFYCFGRGGPGEERFSTRIKNAQKYYDMFHGREIPVASGGGYAGPVAAAPGSYTANTTGDTKYWGYYTNSKGKTFTILRQTQISGWGKSCNRAAAAIIASAYSNQSAAQLVSTLNSNYTGYQGDSRCRTLPKDAYWAKYGLRMTSVDNNLSATAYQSKFWNHINSGGYIAMWVKRSPHYYGKTYRWTSGNMHWIAIVDAFMENGKQYLVSLDWHGVNSSGGGATKNGVRVFPIDEFQYGINIAAYINER